jgi:hypothetical protein
MKNKITLKNGKIFDNIQILLYRINLGDTAVVFEDLSTKDHYIIPLKDMESFLSERAIYSEEKYTDIDQLERARESGFKDSDEVSTVCYGSYSINDTETLRTVISDDYNSIFNKKTGKQKKWGNLPDDKVYVCPWGPEVINFDLNAEKEYVTLQKVKSALYVLPRTVNWINLYLDDLNSNPEFGDIVQYLTNNQYHTVIVNLFTKGENHSLENMVSYINSINTINVVSDTTDTKVCYNFISDLSEIYTKTINIVKEVYDESHKSCLSLLSDLCSKLELEKVNHVIFSVPKEVEVGKSHILDLNKYGNILNAAIDQEIEISVSPCIVPIFRYFVQDEHLFRGLFHVPESCESALFSMYLDSNFNVYPCKSFKNSLYRQRLIKENESFPKEINLLALRDYNIFVKSAWHHPYFEDFRRTLKITLSHKDSLTPGVRHCPILPIYPIVEKAVIEE